MLTRNRGDNQDRNNSLATIFKFENQEVRFVGTAENPWWVAADICTILELDNVSQALTRLDEDEKGYIILNDPLGNEKNYRTVNESGLYSLILSSRKTQAKKFKKWITSEVLPAIRKTGSYSISKEIASDKTKEAAFILDIAAKSAINAGVDPEIAEQLRLEGLAKLFPEYNDVLLLQKNAIAASKRLPELPKTPTEIGQELAVRLGYVKISAKKINSKLLELGYQISVTRIKKSSGKEVHDYYQPTEKGKPHSQLQMTAYTEGEGKSTKAQLRWFSSIITVLANNWEDGNE